MPEREAITLEGGQRHFTVEAANAFVPRLSEVFAAVRTDLEALREVARELAAAGFPLSDEGPVTVDPDAPESVRLQQEQAHALAGKIGATLDEVAGLGVEVKGIDGLVDFLSRRDGEVVYLCWRFGEDCVNHWHDLEGGFAGRQPIGPRDVFEGDALQ
jgi:hypothetical protein